MRAATPTSGNSYIGKLSADFTRDPRRRSRDFSSDVHHNRVGNGALLRRFHHIRYSTVPEPGTVTALGIGLLAIGLFNKKKRASKKSV